MEAKHIEWDEITTAPKVDEKTYKYLQYLKKRGKITKLEKSKISYR